MNARVVAWLTDRRLPLWCALCGVLLTSPSLFIGFHLDDHIHRFMLGELPGASELRSAYESPFGIANGAPASNHWQIEQGIAPFWVHPELRVSLWRPLAELTHSLDMALWPDSAPLMHLHSLLWFGLLLAATALLYRRVMGATVLAGLAALLHALDHNHGFAVGWIANRNALVAASLGVLSLWLHVSAEQRSSRALGLLSAALLGAALLAGEGALVIGAYILGHALFVARGTLVSRLLALAPHLLVVIAWRGGYQLLERGAWGSGMYVDALSTPLRFLAVLPERLPLLWLGQLLGPPPELSSILAPPWTMLLWCLSLLVLALSLLALVPLLRRDRQARFWAFGAAAGLAVACSTQPHSRLLFFVAIGAMPLLCQLWSGLIEGADWLPRPPRLRALASAVVAPAMGVHLLLSPLILPLATASVWWVSRPVELGLSQLARQSRADTELVVLTAPEYFYVKLLPAVQALSGRAGPERLRPLAFGPVELTVERLDARTLRLGYDGGILRDPFSQLYRDARLPMATGERVRLRGVTIEVTGVTDDGRLREARVRFDRPLDAPQLRFVYWSDDGFVPVSLPLPGDRKVLPPARLTLGGV
ncbi:MAG: hypothetical protein OXT09_27265 [Myxococcales bacterium]|nr:hypothetical protein [Myxococcales bacterium]